jgi:type II secretory pathway pseudopilin PulG
MRRHGFTLTELVAVMAVLFAVMGVSVVMLVQVFDFQQTNDQHAEGMRAVDRLVVDFRKDVRTYGKPEIPTDSPTLFQWKTETATVEYVIAPGTFPDQQIVVRTVKMLQDDEQLFRETYRLPDRTTVWGVSGTESESGLVALNLWTAPLGTKAPLPETLNSFDRTIPMMPTLQVDPKYAGNWRTIVARYKDKEHKEKEQ